MLQISAVQLKTSVNTAWKLLTTHAQSAWVIKKLMVRNLLLHDLNKSHGLESSLLYSYLHVHSASQRHNIKGIRRNEGRMIKTHEGIKMQEGRHKKTSLQLYSPLTLLQGFERLACERMLETEHKLHILTPLLWPSRCVVLVLLMLGSTPSGLSEGPLGRVWLSLPHLVSSCLEVCWQLLQGFPRSPSVGCGLPYHISSLTLWESAGNCIGGFRGPPRSGVAFPITSRL